LTDKKQFLGDFNIEKLKLIRKKSWEDGQSHRALLIMMAPDLGEGSRVSLRSCSAFQPKANTWRTSIQGVTASGSQSS